MRRTLSTARCIMEFSQIPDFGKNCGLMNWVGQMLANPGRNAGYPAPPGQIPACGTTALGSCLG